MSTAAELKGYDLSLLSLEELYKLYKRELTVDIDSQFAKELLVEIERREAKK